MFLSHGVHTNSPSPALKVSGDCWKTRYLDSDYAVLTHTTSLISAQRWQLFFLTILFALSHAGSFRM